jgi:hypothetical protein
MSIKKFAQIYNGKAHWVFEAEEKPEFSPDIILVEITGRDDIQEGWDYNSETGEFTEPQPIPAEPQEVPPTEFEILEAKVDYLTMLVEPTEVV